MSHPSAHAPVGQLIGDRYRVEALVGRGGMGRVYAARQVRTGERVAVKLMRADCEDRPALQERFVNEARWAAAVRHPNIVDVLDVGFHEGSPFLVMELLEGVSLEQVLEREKRLSPEQALLWLLPMLDALAALHDAGIVHRDVKPSNLFLSATPFGPCPKLIDFGLARLVSDPRVTRSGTVIGAPLYMAPEHAAGEAAGPAADVWSMGVVLFEALSGSAPFPYTDRASLAAQVLAGVVRPLSLVRPDLPAPLSHALSGALRRELSERYADMRGFADALRAAALASGLQLGDVERRGLADFTAWRARVVSAGAAPPAPSRYRTTQLSLSSQPHGASGVVRRRSLLGPLAALLLACALLAYVLARRATSRPPVSPAPAVGARASA